MPQAGSQESEAPVSYSRTRHSTYTACPVTVGRGWDWGEGGRLRKMRLLIEYLNERKAVNVLLSHLMLCVMMCEC